MIDPDFPFTQGNLIPVQKTLNTQCPQCRVQILANSKGDIQEHYNFDCIYYKGCPRCGRIRMTIEHLRECTTIPNEREKSLFCPSCRQMGFSAEHLRECARKKESSTKCPHCLSTTHPVFLSLIHSYDCPVYGRKKPVKHACSFCGGFEGEHHPDCKGLGIKHVTETRSPGLGPEDIYNFIQGDHPVSVDGLILKASKIAAFAHKGQIRKYSNDPYILHPMRVAGRVMLLEDAGPIEVATAWLHDVIEDTPVTRDELLSSGMPEEVVENVISLSNPSRLMKGKSRIERKSVERAWLSIQSVWVK